MSSAEDLLAQEFGLIPDLVRAHAQERPRHPSLIDDHQTLDYGQLDRGRRARRRASSSRIAVVIV